MVTFVRTILAMFFIVTQLVIAYYISEIIDGNDVFYMFYSLFCIYFILQILKTSRSYSYTLPWIILFLCFPIPGTIVYFITKINIRFSRVLKRVIRKEKECKEYFVQDPIVKERFDPDGTLRYFSDFAHYPVTANNKVNYYPLGEIGFEAMLEDLKKAKKFIFFEYFIVAPGKMWNSILKILEQKAKEGVEVRVLYDDFGSLKTLPSNYESVLRKKGIQCIAFNKIKPFAGVILNNRDHRKILVIDGKVAFSGGINIADEYINIRSRFGHWKDNVIRVSGGAVWNYTVMFLTLWNSMCEEDTDYRKYKVEFKDKPESNQFVVPYGNNPLMNEIVGEDVYLNVINNSNRYLYICTPYLILDNEMMNSLVLAAKRGVDVRIVIPGIPDKKTVYTLSESYLAPLIKGGVRIYKYTPGFIHAKILVSDDFRATVGTFNLDYRSMYLHFECGCYFENMEIVQEIKEDVVESIEKSSEVTRKNISGRWFKSLWQSILRLFAPLM